jgi:hypothetical protein
MVIKNSEQFFYTCDEAALKSAKEMLDWMRTTSQESFECHINSEKNDFVGWVKEILKDNILAKKLEKTEDREKIIEEVEKRIEFKNKKFNIKENLISQIKKAISHESS